MEYEVISDIPSDLDTFTRAYLECAEWCGLMDRDDGRKSDRERMSDTYRTVRWSRRSIARAKEDCDAFQEANADDLATIDDASRSGHDFWLTRNRHGAGFWDRGYPSDVAERLTKDSHAYGDTHVWYDGKAARLILE